MTKEARLYNGEKIVSLIRVTRKTGQLHIKKNEIPLYVVNLIYG